QAVFVQQLHQPPVADAVAPVALGIGDDIGRRLGPTGAAGVLRGIELIELDVRRNPEGQFLAAGPDDLRPVPIGPGVVEVGVCDGHAFSSSCASYRCPSAIISSRPMRALTPIRSVMCARCAAVPPSRFSTDRKASTAGMTARTIAPG